MVVISSKSTKLYKVVFPTFWFGILATMMFTALRSQEVREFPLFLIGPLAMGAFGFFMFRKLVWVLADEVRDGGDFLVVRRGSEEITVYLSNIMNVSVTKSKPPHVTLRLVQPGKFGSEIVFTPMRKGFSLDPFKKIEVPEDLMVRVDRARRSASR